MVIRASPVIAGAAVDTAHRCRYDSGSNEARRGVVETHSDLRTPLRLSGMSRELAIGDGEEETAAAGSDGDGKLR